MLAFPCNLPACHRKNADNDPRHCSHRWGLLNAPATTPVNSSGGQQQRVAAARALVNNPRLILADEPTGNLDTVSGIGIMQLLSELHKEGRSVLVVTHDQRMERFATHKVFLLDGKVVSEKQYRNASLE